MQYSEAIFTFHFSADYEQDLLYQGLADLGFESFVDNIAYIPTAQLDEAAVRHFCETSGLAELTEIRQCADENWNAAWEAEHPVEELPLGVRITPHCAFGAGHHETTRMMVSELVSRFAEGARLQGCRVLDMGCGTGVLGIMAAKCGAEVTAVDIDDKSVKNTLENAEANQVTVHAIEAATVPVAHYHLILANIHRNILIEQMPDYGACLQADDELWLSGFYEIDIPALTAAAQAVGLRWTAERQDGDWRMLTFIKEK